MKKKRSLLIGGCAERRDEKRCVSLRELKHVKGRSGAAIDPNGGFKSDLIGGSDPVRN